MKIIKVFNNNIVMSLDDRGREVILLGKGIGFQKKKGDDVDECRISKNYYLEDVQTKQIYELIGRIPMKIIVIADQIIQEARKKLEVEILDSAIISLSDHIYFAINTFRSGIKVPNLLLEETKTMFPREFEIGRWAVDLINKEFHINFDDSEAGFITIHIVNANFGLTETNATIILQFIAKIIKEIEKEFEIVLNVNSLNYSRIVYHLKIFCLKRYANQKETIQHSAKIYTSLLEKEGNLKHFFEKVDALVQETFGHSFSTEEKLYLSLHILRLLNNGGD